MRLSCVAAMKTSPPAVTIGPPYNSVPVGATPFAVSEEYVPSGMRHVYSPVFMSMALSVPHGGLMAGNPSGVRHRS